MSARDVGTRPSAWAEVYAVVRRIPRGRVMSYGQIAGLLRRPLSARAVGWAMRQCPESVPWQRVVNASGGISTEHLHEPSDLQRRLLEREGVRFGRDGTLPMAKYRWEPRVASSRAMKNTARPARAERARPGGSARAAGAEARESGRPPRAKSEGSEPSVERGEHSTKRKK